MKIRPIRKNLLLEPPVKESITKGGIFIPEVADPNAKGLTKGKIIDYAEDCDTRKFKFKPGMTVLFNRFAYTEIKVPSTEPGQMDKLLLLVNEDKIEACIDE